MNIESNKIGNKFKSIFIKKRNLILLLGVISVFLIIGGYIYYSSEEKTFQRNTQNELQTIANLKTNQISEWYQDELSDANIIAKDIFLNEKIDNYLNTGSSKDYEQVNKFLNSLAEQHNYEDILATKRTGEVIVSAKEKLKNINPSTLRIIQEPQKSNSTKSTSLFRDKEENKNYIDFITPVVSDNRKENIFLIFRINANENLYPLIRYWPTINQSSESFIVKKEADSVQILSELKYADNKNLNFKLGLTERQLPSVRAILGYTGVYEGKSYYGAEVLSHIAKIDKTPWFIVTQINKNEVYANLKHKATIIGVFIIVLIILFGTGLTSIHNHSQRNIYLELYNKEKELWHTQEKFKISLNSIGEGVITTDLDGKIEYMNILAEQLTGWNLKEARGKRVDEIYAIRNEETGKKENKIIDKVLKEGITKELANHTILISKAGKEIPVMDTGAPIKDKDGTIKGVVLAFLDETEKRRQRQLIKNSEARLRSTLDNMMEGCQIISKEWRYIYLNNSAVKHSRTKRENLLGKTMMEVYPGIENTEMFATLKLSMNERTTKLIENEFTYPNGKKGWFELSIQPAEEGLFILSHDISERKQAEAELIKAKEKAEELNRIKSNFFANMSHELRTPLVGILGFGDILNEKTKEDNELSEMTGFIKASGERLLETLNKVLNIAKLESDKTDLELKAVNIIPTIRESAKLFSLTATKKNIEFQFITDKEEAICNTDLKLLRNILDNLINNAIKYTEKGSVTVKTQESNGAIKIIVNDTGIGIPKEKHDIIWEEFRQVSEGMSRSYEGTGLGLTIAKKYTELLGGKIAVESSEENGSTFTLELELLKAEEIKPSRFEKMDGEGLKLENIDFSKEKKKILYVEDDSISQKLVSFIVKELYCLDVAETSKTTLMKVKQNRYDLILMDINLENGISGIELAGIIRKLPEYENIPIIAVTAYAMEDDKEVFLSNGITDYISKPFKKDKLIKVLQENLTKILVN